MNTLPKTVTVTEVRERRLDLSYIRYAVVSDQDSATVYALFRWKERAEDYVKKYAQSYRIVDLDPQQPSR